MIDEVREAAGRDECGECGRVVDIQEDDDCVTGWEHDDNGDWELVALLCGPCARDAGLS